MAKAPAYAVLGGGRWARRIHGILTREGHKVTSIENTRLESGEDEAGYKSRVCASLLASHAQIAWLCDPPGPHNSLLIEAALEVGLHVLAEKPWLCSHRETDSLVALAKARKLIVGIHYEYCLLEGVEKWRHDFSPGKELTLGGRFTMSRPGPPGVNAIDNLGSHLFAIRAYAVPESRMGEICCSFEEQDERRVWIVKGGQPISSIDFLKNKEPIIERFIGKFEAALKGASFPFGLDFALRVSDDLRASRPTQECRLT